MPIMEKSLRRHSEELRYANYPEVAQVEDDLRTFLTYMETVQSAIAAYEDLETDKIILNMADLVRMLELSYSITDVLGRASRPCYDILIGLRDMQDSLHDIQFSYLSEGSRTVRDTSEVADGTASEE